MRFQTSLFGLAVASLVLVGCESTPEAADGATSQPTTAPASPGMINEQCPLSGNGLDADSPTVSYSGTTVGVCCDGCIGRWDKMSDADKGAFIAKSR